MEYVEAVTLWEFDRRREIRYFVFERFLINPQNEPQVEVSCFPFSNTASVVGSSERWYSTYLFGVELEIAWYLMLQ